MSAVFAALVFLCGLISRRLERTATTAPMVFTAAGILIFPVPGLPEWNKE